jgi:hypothetical protein
VLAANLHNVPLAVFVKSLLRDTDAMAAAGGLVISTLLFTKLPGTYVEQYSREGTYAALQKLASHVPSTPKTDQSLQVCSLVTTPCMMSAT